MRYISDVKISGLDTHSPDAESRVVEIPRIEVRLIVFLDAARAEFTDRGCVSVVGWFRDEVDALSALFERILMQSAILPELRKLPELSISSEYRPLTSGHEISQFRRGTAAKSNQSERRIVLSSGARSKAWLQSKNI